MEYLDNQHKILKYLCKFKFGVTKAHIKCLKEVGEDFDAIKTKEMVVYKDAIVDKTKLKILFSDKNIMNTKDFDASVSLLLKDALITKDFIVTEVGKAKNKEVFKKHYASDIFAKDPENKGIDASKLLFND